MKVVRLADKLLAANAVLIHQLRTALMCVVLDLDWSSEDVN